MCENYFLLVKKVVINFRSSMFRYLCVREELIEIEALLEQRLLVECVLSNLTQGKL